MYKRASGQNPRSAPLLPDDPRPSRQPRRQSQAGRKAGLALYPVGPRGAFGKASETSSAPGAASFFGQAEGRSWDGSPGKRCACYGRGSHNDSRGSRGDAILLSLTSHSRRADRPAIDSSAIRARKGARETTPQTSSPQRLKKIRHAKILHFSFARSARNFPGRALWPATQNRNQISATEEPTRHHRRTQGPRRPR